MSKPVELAKFIQADFSYDHSEKIEEYGYSKIFGSVYNGPEEIEDKNRIICFIVHAYHPDSLWLDLKKDRIDNKRKIIHNLSGDPDSSLFKSILDNKNDPVAICIFNFLEDIKDWRWRSIFDLLEYASKMSRFASKDTEEEKQWDEVSKDGQKHTLTEEVSMAEIVKVNKQKGELIDQAMAAREKADKLLEQIRKEYVATDNAVQQDFNFSFTDTSKKRDPLSWREFIKSRVAV